MYANYVFSETTERSEHVHRKVVLAHMSRQVGDGDGGLVSDDEDMYSETEEQPLEPAEVTPKPTGGLETLGDTNSVALDLVKALSSRLGFSQGAAERALSLLKQRPGSTSLGEQMNAATASQQAAALQLEGEASQQALYQVLMLPDGPEKRRRVLSWLSALELAATEVVPKLIDGSWRQDPNISLLSGKGLAGGTKFKARNCFFKFTEDPNLGSEDQPRFLYGGSKPSAELAAKAAANELRGADILFEYFFHDGSVVIPPQLLVDMGGQRVVVMPLLSLENTQLIYGSADGGRSVFNEHPKFDSKICRAAEKLNLAPHRLIGSRICGKIAHAVEKAASLLRCLDELQYVSRHDLSIGRSLNFEW
eukprot:g44916.t1